ncbi:uncharacterized protein J3D65DRAFT_628950 [Phyllosticta citribraziliensis]|uniref:Secreted protein n=1 Tax=Phyllosticta citribraziliensis TaxID=989973 RepID=A0ABR1LHU0_9PEZI
MREFCYAWLLFLSLFLHRLSDASSTILCSRFYAFAAFHFPPLPPQSPIFSFSSRRAAATTAAAAATTTTAIAVNIVKFSIDPLAYLPTCLPAYLQVPIHRKRQIYTLCYATRCAVILQGGLSGAGWLRRGLPPLFRPFVALPAAAPACVFHPSMLLICCFLCSVACHAIATSEPPCLFSCPSALRSALLLECSFCFCFCFRFPFVSLPFPVRAPRTASLTRHSTRVDLRFSCFALQASPRLASLPRNSAIARQHPRASFHFISPRTLCRPEKWR